MLGKKLLFSVLAISLICPSQSQIAFSQDSSAQSPPPNEEKQALADSRLVIKNGRHFLVLDPQGMISGKGAGGYGLYADDTRFLSNWELSINEQKPKLLSASVREGFAGQFLYSNAKSAKAAEGTILIQRDLAIRNGMIEKITVTNYSTEKQIADLSIDFLSDFYDMFEVRGQIRKQRGTFLPEEGNTESKVLPYRGLDGLQMATTITVRDAAPVHWVGKKAQFHFELPAGKSSSVELSAQTQVGDEKVLSANSIPSYKDQLAQDRADYAKWRSECASITSGNELLNQIVDQAYRDIYILRQPTPRGWCLSAGLPWFAVAFGRDELVTGLQTLPLMPALSRDILAVLANYQGSKEDTFTEERKGKIMHELRLGEMARCREIPFIPYYGTVDATPLWLVLLGRYSQWTGDYELAKKYWNNAEQALEYLDKSSAGGYLSYGGAGALSNQGWKDSGDSIMYSNGELAKAPIALCEVQGYLYESWKSTADLAARFGKVKLAEKLNAQAAALRSKFQKDFWLKDRNMVALALDGQGKPCDVIASNAGHLLGTGILTPEQETLVAQRLVKPDMFCGWGVRTLSSQEKRYNPMSYHDGSVWPHDNGMIVSGMSRAGKSSEANLVMQGVLDAARFQSNTRLPELFCGFTKTEFKEPVPYPVSCSPQAWAAGSMLQMLMANLQLRMDPKTNILHVSKSSIPASLGTITLKGVKVGNGNADLSFTVSIAGKREAHILRKTTDAQVIID